MCLKKESQRHEKFPFFNLMEEITNLRDAETDDSKDYSKYELELVKIQDIEANSGVFEEPRFFPNFEVKAVSCDILL